MSNSPVRQADVVTPGHIAVWGRDGYLIDGPSVDSIGVGAYSQPAFHVERPNPAPTSSLTYQMMGLGLVFVPNTNARGIFIVDGLIGNTNNNAETDTSLVFGTGTAPANGDAQTGALLGQPVKFLTARSGEYAPFSQTALLEGLTAGTTYWVDLAVQVNAGTSIISNVQVTGFTLVDVASSAMRAR